MVISSKGRYALRIMVYLAEKEAGEYVPLKEIAENEHISQKYLESIATILSKSHLIEAASGHKGGYHLSKEPDDYTVGEILRLTEGTLAPVACLKEDASQCERVGLCYTYPIWQGLAETINNYLDGIRLSDVVASAEHMKNENSPAAAAN